MDCATQYEEGVPRWLLTSLTPSSVSRLVLAAFCTILIWAVVIEGQNCCHRGLGSEEAPLCMMHSNGRKAGNKPDCRRVSLKEASGTVLSPGIVVVVVEGGGEGVAMGRAKRAGE